MMKTPTRFAIALASAFVAQHIAPAPASDSAVYDKLSASRDALLSQKREVLRSRQEVSVHIQELQRQEGILDNYLNQLDRSITDVERAMYQLR